MADERKKTDELIKSLTDKIISNSKDAKWAKEMLTQLAGLYQMDKEIDIAVKDVTDTLDLGACVIKRCRQGYIFEAKGGMQTFVSWRMARVCAMLNTLFELNAKPDKTADDNTIYAATAQAIEYVFECPIFSSLDERTLFENADNILKTFGKYATDTIDNAEAVDETEEDIKENIQAEQMADALEELANSPLPPED